jgi:hypothetical protein
VAFLFLVAGAGAGWFYFEVWHPQWTFYRDEAWGKTAPEADIRQVCHKMISHRFGSHHDAFLYLANHGNKDSVPLLIRALKWREVKEGDLLYCTPAHCVGALRSLTGEDFGASWEKWQTWWNETGCGLAEEHFYPRLGKGHYQASVEEADSTRTKSHPPAGAAGVLPAQP